MRVCPCVVNPPPIRSKRLLIACLNFLLAYIQNIQNTPCFHCRKMALPDINDPLFFYDDIAAAREEDEVVV